MLVVVAIVSVLAALLLPALQQARVKAQLIRCTSGIRQVSITHMTYMDDSDGVMLASGRAVKGDVWYDRLVTNGYAVETMFTSDGGCPQAPAKYQLKDNNDSFYGHKKRWLQSSYAINTQLTGMINGATKIWTVDEVGGIERDKATMNYGRYAKYAEDVMLFHCSTVPNFISHDHRGLTIEHTLGYPTPWVKDPSEYMRHAGQRLPLAFAEGHVESVTMAYWKTDTDREIRWKSVCAYYKKQYKNNGKYAQPD